MDVVNGKIVSSSSKPGGSNSDLYSALKRSRSVLEGMAWPYPHGSTDQLAGSYSSLRERMDWVGTSGPCSTGAAVSQSWGSSMGASRGRRTTMASSISPEPGTGRWNRAAKDSILGQPHKQSAAAPSFSPALDSPLPYSSVSFVAAIPGATDPQPGWKVPDSGRDSPSARSYTRSEGRAALDKEMNRFESQLCRAISGQLEIPDEELGLEAHAGADHTFKRQHWMEEVSENEVGGTEAVTDKKQKIELSDDDQDESSWIAPLRFLIRKVLSVSDVGTLGRIVLPKKDAEVQLPLIDTKEGKLLEMEDYSISRRWSFRYKWWINNKSRMYVLENTGEFIRHHCLKENDSFNMYEDGCGKLVVRGQKKPIPHSDSAIIPLKQVASSNVENPANSDGPSATTSAKDD